MRKVICDYCGKPAQFVDSAIVYHGHSYGMIYYCHACNAWVGCHKGSDKPMGRLANAELRNWKRGAHAVFDPLWRRRIVGNRQKAYAWLSEQMGLPREKTHIGMFDVDQCKEVIRICKEARNHEKEEQSQQPKEPATPVAQWTEDEISAAGRG